MIKRLSIGLTLGIVILPSLVLFADSPAIAQSRSDRHYYCDSRASDRARRKTSNGTLKGAARGAATGAVVGLIAGKRKVGRGAAIGGIVGAIGGTVDRDKKRTDIYRREYDRCMRLER